MKFSGYKQKFIEFWIEEKKKQFWHLNENRASGVLVIFGRARKASTTDVMSDKFPRETFGSVTYTMTQSRLLLMRW